ncbi:hypothetical protein [Erythrobacter sp. JK5]|uniref:hypothetical protein n=1 Tax=Erythrobacter sp. JK5 TaxID=2829500 RepID=UPI001BA93159|nr:hypothetical protein [Erythrobacter sp. JK5]QUL38739.1 hypothetical protein KDC96_05005 [Erythrobacter sp. JK5]
MKAVILTVLAIGLIGAKGDVDPAESRSSNPPPTLAPSSDAAISSRLADLLKRVRAEDCRDRIHRARAAAGLPLLDREPAAPDRPYLIYAVDRRQDGCSVMMMKGDPDDIRQLPRPMEGSQLIPARKPGE